MCCHCIAESVKGKVIITIMWFCLRGACELTIAVEAAVAEEVVESRTEKPLKSF
jgi:hypothetical protein